MAKEIEHLMKELERLRAEGYLLLRKSGDLQAPEILEASRRFDSALTRYYKALQEHIKKEKP